VRSLLKDCSILLHSSISNSSSTPLFPHFLNRFLRRSDVAFIFHLIAFILYVRVWVWHTTPAALALPGSSGFGWFFRYLTFWSYTLQLLQLSLCVLARVSKNPKRKCALGHAADRLSCAAFGLANTVTAMFYAVENSTQGLVEGGRAIRPWWLAASVHSMNSGVAWIDLIIVEERSFSGKSRHLALFLAVSYALWLLVVRQFYGKFPYPVLNNLPFPMGYVCFMSAGISLVFISFELGKFVKLSLLGNGGGSSRGKEAKKKTF
jgi:hypothetical protein